MGTYVTRAMLNTSVSKTTLKRLRQISKSTGIPISRIIDEVTADRYAQVADVLTGGPNTFVSSLVELNLRKKLGGSKLGGDTQPASHSDTDSEAQP